LIERKYDQRQLGEGFIRDSIDDCWEPWMKIADEILDDEELIEPVYEALRLWSAKMKRRGFDQHVSHAAISSSPYS